jgi:glycosyltransferase involved in cell wall biosynthesis
MHVRRVHFSQGDDSGWAIDEDLRLVRSALAGRFEDASLLRSEIVHGVWWVRMLAYSRRDLRGKHVLCNADNAPFYYMTEPEFLKAREQVTLWIARSREAVAQFSSMGLESRFAPYTFDPALFRPIPREDPQIRALVEKWKIPKDRYLIANFHRDTEGSDLASPKLQKGPDAFLEIVARLHEEGAPIHILLAGPRRFYLRRTLAERGVPFTFMGEDTGGRDDFGVNILPRPMLNLLYNIADLHLISSRWEGGPQSVLESAATRCKVISTPVGLAPDVLAPECLFSDIAEACEIVRRDIRENFLAPHSEAQFARAQQNHTEEALRRHLRRRGCAIPSRGARSVRSLPVAFASAPHRNPASTCATMRIPHQRPF